MTFQRFMLSGGALGFVPLAPGSVGSLLPVVLVAAATLCGLPPNTTFLTLGAIAFLAGVVCLVFTDAAEKLTGSKDPAWIIADEIAGQSVALLLPWDALRAATPAWRCWMALALAFFLFRVFDILKPPPIRYLQHLAHGWGVLADDLLAGLAALGLGWTICLLWLIP